MGALALLLTLSNKHSSITIRWETASESNAAGFYVSRSHSATGTFSRLNDALIPAKGNAFTGASYAFIDPSVVPGTTYYYLLEEVELDSSLIRYANNAQVYKAPYFSVQDGMITAISILIGLMLIVIDLKKRRRV